MGKENSRWTYTAGSRPEGVVVYDDDTKLHSHHDTDPARGQHSAFDVVRLHRFGSRDSDADKQAPVTDRPSYRAMVEFAESLPEIRGERARTEFEDLGPLPVVTEELISGDSQGSEGGRFTIRTAAEFGSGPPMDWIVRGVLPRAELAVIYGESGSGKSFAVLDLSAAITRGVEWRTKRTVKGRVVYVCAEGAGGFKARLRAYERANGVDLGESFGVLPDAPNLLDPKDAKAIADQIIAYFSKEQT